MLRYSLSILLIISFGSLCAQHRIDSLRHLVSISEGTEKVDVLNRIAFETATINDGESVSASREAYSLSDQIHYEKGKALALLYMAYNKYGAGQLSQSDSLLHKSIDLSRKLKDQSLQGYGYACLSSNFQDRGLFDSASYYSHRSYNLLKSGENPYYLSILYNTRALYFQLIIEPDSQLFYINKSWNIRKKLPDKFYLVYAGNNLADYYTRYRNYQLALAYLDSSQQAMRGDTIANEAIANIWANRAIIYTRLSDYSRASSLFEKAKDYYSKNLFPQELNRLLNDMAELYEDMGDYEASLASGSEALALAEKNHFTLQRTKALIHIAWSYFYLKQLALSEKFIRLALDAAIKSKETQEEGSGYNLYGQILREKNSREALSYFRKCLAIRIKHKSISGQAEQYSNIGEFYFRYSTYDSALYYHLLSLRLISKVPNITGKTLTLARVGHTYTQLKEYTKAAYYLNHAETIADSIKSGTVMLEVLRYKRELVKLNKDWNAYSEYTTRYETLSDSLFKNEVTNRIALIETLYETRSRNAEIANQKNQLSTQEKELSFRRNQIILISSAGALTIIVAIVLLLAYTSTRKLNRKIVEQNKDLAKSKEAIQTQNSELVLKNEEISSQRNLIEKQRNDLDSKNDELKIIVKKRTKELLQYIQQLEQFTFISSHNLRAPTARILGLGNLLELNGINSTDSSVIHKALIETTRELDKVIRDLNLILEIRRNSDIVLSPVSLKEVVQTIRISLQNEIVNSRALILEDFSEVDEINTFRPYLQSILLNIISNGIKYRRPENNPVINIKSINKNKFVCIKISDNGLGIDLKLYGDKLFTLYKRFHDHVEGKGLGLYMVKTQIITLGGKIKVKSEVNSGTTFFLYFKK